MIIIAGIGTIQREKREQALALARITEEATIQEEGCISYRFYTDPQDDSQIFVFETWANEASLIRHIQSPHMAHFNQKLPQLLAAPPAMKRYDVSSVTDM